MNGENRLVQTLKDKGLTISTAESMTAGMVSSTIVRVPGASAVFKGGFVTYAPSSKTSILGVPESVLAAKGVISGDCAIAMAEGACRVAETDVSISTTGNAGPDVLEYKPVGRVFIAICVKGVTTVREYTFPGDRESIRRQATNAAIRDCENRLLEL